MNLSTTVPSVLTSLIRSGIPVVCVLIWPRPFGKGVVTGSTTTLSATLETTALTLSSAASSVAGTESLTSIATSGYMSTRTFHVAVTTMMVPLLSDKLSEEVVYDSGEMRTSVPCSATSLSATLGTTLVTSTRPMASSDEPTTVPPSVGNEFMSFIHTPS